MFSFTIHSKFIANPKFLSFIGVSLLSASMLSACGGGGGGSSTTTPASSTAALSSIAASSVAPSSVAASSSPASSSTPASSIAASSTPPSSVAASSVASSTSSGTVALKTIATFPVGVAVSNTDYPTYNVLTNTNESTIAEKHFQQMTAGNIMKVSYLHPNNNTGTSADYTFTNADAFVDYAAQHDMKIHAHTLVWHSSYQVPAFIKNWAGTSADFLTMLDLHVDTIVKHFAAKGNVVSWDVVNEAINDSNPADFRTDSPFYIKSGNSAVYIERAFTAARNADANVDLFYNDYNLEQNGAKMTKVEAMVIDFKNRNIPITGVGFQMHVFMDYPPVATLSAAMKRIVDQGLKVKISEMDVAINNPYSSGWTLATATPYDTASKLAQKKRYCEIVKAYMDTVPSAQRAGITVWGISDINSWIDTGTSPNVTQYGGQQLGRPLMFDNSYAEKPALKGFADALQGVACTNLP